MTVKPSISLTDEQHAFAEGLVKAGRYASLSAVLQQGLDVLRQRIDAEEAETEALRALLARRRAGESVSAADMERRLAAMIAEERAALGLDD
jgi:antitoxin ParD1/3/4